MRWTELGQLSWAAQGLNRPDRRTNPSAGALYPIELYLVTGEGVFHYRTEAKYGDRAERYVHLEAGHVSQSVLLQSVSLELGAVPIGAFVDSEVQRLLDLPECHEPLYLIPVGHPEE